jgi:TonB family protein
MVFLITPQSCLLHKNLQSVNTKPNTNSKNYTTDHESYLPMIDDSEFFIYFHGGNGFTSDTLLRNFIRKNVIYPDSAEKKGIEGSVSVTFQIDKNGIVSHPEIVKSSNQIFNAEAIRLVSIMPNWDWDPIVSNNRRKTVMRGFSIKFSLQR